MGFSYKTLIAYKGGVGSNSLPTSIIDYKPLKISEFFRGFFLGCGERCGYCVCWSSKCSASDCMSSKCSDFAILFIICVCISKGGGRKVCFCR